MKLNKQTRLKLAAQLNFGRLETDKGTLIYEGDLSTGKEAFLASSDEDPIPAPDDTYETDNLIVTVSDGKISQIQDKNESEEDAQSAAEEVEETAEEIESALVEVLDLVGELQEELTQVKAELSSVKHKFSELEKPMGKPVDQRPGERKGFSSVKGSSWIERTENKLKM